MRLVRFHTEIAEIARVGIRNRRRSVMLCKPPLVKSNAFGQPFEAILL